MRKQLSLLAALMLTLTVSGAELREFVVLRTILGSEIEHEKDEFTISGDVSLADKKFTPASTFKVLIAWAALEEGLVTPETKFLVSDKFVPDAPRELDLHEAMYFSSNDYFDKLGKMLGREKLEKYITLSGYAGGKPPQGWLDNMDAVERGGTLAITPRENHQFMLKLVKQELCSSEKIFSDLLLALRWPADCDEVGLMGKTGTADGVLWFNGIGTAFRFAEVVTVFARGGAELRPAVIQKFYAEFGEKFDEAWLKKYPAGKVNDL